MHKVLLILFLSFPTVKNIPLSDTTPKTTYISGTGCWFYYHESPSNSFIFDNCTQ